MDRNWNRLRGYGGKAVRINSWPRLVLIAGLLVLWGLPVEIQAGQGSEIGIKNRLGATVPLDLTFKDENGQPVQLGQLIHTPVFLAPVYFRCTDVCPALLNGVVDALNQLQAEPGKDYTVFAVSFDETDTPDSALVKKRNYLGLIRKPFPENAWLFLTGDSASIRTLMDSVGFGYQKGGDGFLHPVALIVLSPKGKVVRYLYGSDFLPMDLKMALVEAEHERAGPAVTRVLRFCFRYEPKSRKLVFNTMKVTGTVTLAFALAFMAFLIFGGKKRASKER
jgi:protein SCO1/2